MKPLSLPFLVARIGVVSTLIAITVASSFSCMPTIPDIDLSLCIQVCNNETKNCFDDANEKLISCSVDDNLCLSAGIKMTEDCLTTCLDCIASCTAEVEDVIKEM